MVRFGCAADTMTAPLSGRIVHSPLKDERTEWADVLADVRPDAYCFTGFVRIIRLRQRVRRQRRLTATVPGIALASSLTPAST